jgi:hypothetical protein
LRGLAQGPASRGRDPLRTPGRELVEEFERKVDRLIVDPDRSTEFDEQEFILDD